MVPVLSAGLDESPAEPVALFEEDDAGAELEGAPRGHQPGEAAAGDDDAHRMYLGQGEGGLVLDVLDAHALRSPDEDRQGVRPLDEVLYL